MGRAGERCTAACGSRRRCRGTKKTTVAVCAAELRHMLYSDGGDFAGLFRVLCFVVVFCVLCLCVVFCVLWFVLICVDVLICIDLC